MSQWYISRENKQYGPVSGSDLKRFAEEGKLKSTDLVRRDGSSDWVQASRVKALFKNKKEPVKPLPVTPRDNEPMAISDENSSEKWYQHPVVIVLSLWLFFPLGLVLIWTRSTWSINTKSVWTGSYFAIIFFIGFLMSALVHNNGLTNDADSSLSRGGAFNGGQNHSLGVSQEKLLRPSSSFDVETNMSRMGTPLTYKQNHDNLRIWRVGGMNLLAASGPRKNLTGVFVFSGYSSDAKDALTGTSLSLSIIGVLNPDLGSGKKWPEGDSLLNWMTSLISEKKSGEKSINGKRVIFENRFPLGYQLSILPQQSNVDPNEIFSQMMED